MAKSIWIALFCVLLCGGCQSFSRQYVQQTDCEELKKIISNPTDTLDDLRFIPTLTKTMLREAKAEYDLRKCAYFVKEHSK